ncbi:hypothetical protein T12_8993 [Trichinella patagoniensis]|uniref:Uncharacterized protein n=1 Tax=Trichinella patagoniensis TaxID=990121 RepID=A0A0V0ZY89_9BILA|nr:hypothetical protein T12_8993 [Trichinella patagoniensis]
MNDTLHFDLSSTPHLLHNNRPSKNCRTDEIALLVTLDNQVSTVEQNSSTLLLGTVDAGQYSSLRILGYHWTHVHVWIVARTNANRFGTFDQKFYLISTLHEKSRLFVYLIDRVLRIGVSCQLVNMTTLSKNANKQLPQHQNRRKKLLECPDVCRENRQLQQIRLLQ